MATFFQSVRQGFGRGSNKNNNGNNSSSSNANSNNNSGGGSNTNNIMSQKSSSPAQSPSPHIPAQTIPSNVSLSMPTQAGAEPAQNEQQRDTIQYFFQEKYAPLNVKGNFLTLCACPKNVELGEWLAHQVVEQNRLLHGMLQIVQEVNGVTGAPICNEMTCPTMSAGNVTYTSLIDGKAAKISAPKFINRVEKWIVSKIHDPVMFPTEPVTSTPSTSASSELLNTDSATSASSQNTNPASAPQDWIGKSSGFPPTFYKDCQGIMRQMFRCYAHLYHAHWEKPFWHINKHEMLNMCFVHFVTVAKYYRLVSDKEMEPLQPLIDIYVKQEKIPPEASSGHWQQPAS